MHAVAASHSRGRRRSKAVKRAHITRRPYGRRARGTPLVRDNLPLTCGVAWLNIRDAVTRSRVASFSSDVLPFLIGGVGMPEPPELFKGRRGLAFYACLTFEQSCGLTPGFALCLNYPRENLRTQ